MDNQYVKFSLYFQPSDPNQEAVFDLLNRAGRKKTFLILSLLSAFVDQFPDFPVEDLSKKQISNLLHLYFSAAVQRKPFIMNGFPSSTTGTRAKGTLPKNTEKKHAFPAPAKKQAVLDMPKPAEAPSPITESVTPGLQEDDLLLLDGLNMF